MAREGLTGVSCLALGLSWAQPRCSPSLLSVPVSGEGTQDWACWVVLSSVSLNFHLRLLCIFIFIYIYVYNLFCVFDFSHLFYILIFLIVYMFALHTFM